MPPPALTVLDRAGGWVLMPNLVRVDAVVARIAAAADVQVIAGTVTAATVSEIPARAEEAGEIAGSPSDRDDRRGSVAGPISPRNTGSPPIPPALGSWSCSRHRPDISA
ncbi:hypothetical protein [Nocardia aurantiaca]|uniref:Uncharacterized protein n=1 Tax=Nocardia aurantiaca TaxID=2675850 RepID=A0A6I3KZM4_9NOCA|nr:hypothetical protein [Nocardia aurantiaca]MTE14951.1 hypothetical protein [Nocardia aurantiaca]